MVSVFKPGGRRHYYCQWRDPKTRNKVTRSTWTDDLKAACIVAGKLSLDVGQITWSDFHKAYQAEVLAPLSEATKAGYRATFSAVELHAQPVRLVDLKAPAISAMVAALRASELEDSTIRGHLDNLRAALKWGKEQGYLPELPVIRLPARGGMRGRPINLEEFERMRAAVKHVVHQGARDYDELVEGLWLSGLRLNEAYVLSWDQDADLCVDMMSYKRPMFRIVKGTDKARQERCFPIAPEFVAWLNRVPVERRRGRVFLRRRRPSLNWLSKRITKFGERARIKVADKRGKVKWASAHDLRRSFGFRWAHRVLPTVLMALMRHASIQTTMTYYVGQNGAAAADEAWKAFEALEVTRCPA